MAVDPTLIEFLKDPRNTVRRPPPHVALDKVRRAANAAMLGKPGPALNSVRDVTVQGDGHAVAVRIYRPKQERPLPLIVFCHGGGWVWGTLDTHDALCRALASGTEAVVAAVNYRLAPETKFPGQIEDVGTVIQFLIHNADELGLDLARVALCGDSAGGNLAIAAVKVMRREGRDPRHLSLFYPALDPTCASQSQKAFADGFMLTGDAMRWFWECYLNNETDAENPLAAPLAGGSIELSQLPPVTVVTAEYDILRDEGEVFADQLVQAGVPVKLRRVPGMIHGFLSIEPASRQASAVLESVIDDIRSALLP